MKKQILVLFLLLTTLTLASCRVEQSQPQILATTAPVYTFTKHLCRGTDLYVDQLITENISCLHNYTLQTTQMRAMESAEYMIISGAGLEDFLEVAQFDSAKIIDASLNIPLHCTNEPKHSDHDHHHSGDPHIWLSPTIAMQMSTNIANGLSTKFPQHEKTIGENLKSLLKELEKLQNDADIAFSQVNSNKLVTFHDGFSYMADAFHLEILHSIEEESGSEASAAELIEISNIIKNNNIHSIFTERNGSTSAANVIASETGVKIYQLDTGIANGDYFDVMYQNIKVLKEGLQ